MKNDPDITTHKMNPLKKFSVDDKNYKIKVVEVIRWLLLLTLSVIIVAIDLVANTFENAP